MNTLLRTLAPNHLASVISKVVLLALLLFAPFSFADSTATQKMAEILINLDHFPSAEQKETLITIADNDSNSDTVRTIADAIHDIEHKAKTEDVAAMEEIIADSSTSKAERQLAEVVVSINHTVSAEAKEKLKTIAQ